MTDILVLPNVNFRDLRCYMLFTFAEHIGRFIYACLSKSRSGIMWTDAVDRYWHLAVNSTCEVCLRSLFREKFSSNYHVKGLVATIYDAECIWAKLMFDFKFARDVRLKVSAGGFSCTLVNPACMCDPALPITPRASATANRPHLPARSLTGLNILSYERTTPDYNRQLGIDERYLP